MRSSSYLKIDFFCICPILVYTVTFFYVHSYSYAHRSWISHKLTSKHQWIARVAKLLYRKPLEHHGLWWVVLLLYSHTVYTSMTILNCPSISDSLGSHSPVRRKQNNLNPFVFTIITTESNCCNTKLFTQAHIFGIIVCGQPAYQYMHVAACGHTSFTIIIQR